MKINVKAIAKAVLVLVFLTILPIVGRQWIPSELFRALTMQGGFDLIDLLNRIAVIGIVAAILIGLMGHVEKTSAKFLALSVGWKVFWLSIVFFLFGLGHPETLGLAILGGKAGGAENIVIFDFRLFAGLATAITALMIVRLIIQYQENRPKVSEHGSKNNSKANEDTSTLTSL